MSDSAIQVENVWKKFRKGELHDSLRELIPALARRAMGKGPKAGELQSEEFWALRDVSFEVKRGESLGIIGPNGAGKSTMLKLLSRIIKPNRGAYRVDGRVSALIEVGAGFHQDLTGRENIYLNGTILGMTRKEIRAKEDTIIDFAGIEAFIETPVKRYSSGMLARLGFAVAAHLEPDVLLVDEVLSVGDARFRDKCIRHMHKLIDSDVTVVFISHILEQVRQLCPNTIVLDKGEVVYQGQTGGAILTYLKALGDGVGEERTGETDGEIRNIRLCDAQGHEQLAWSVGEPGVIEFDVAIRKPLEIPSLVLNISSLDGAYLGTANSLTVEGAIVSIPGAPGTYRVRHTLDPMPLAKGDYKFDFKLFDGDKNETYRCLWSTQQSRTISVRGEGPLGGVIRCEGQWDLLGRLEPGGELQSVRRGDTSRSTQPTQSTASPHPAH